MITYTPRCKNVDELRNIIKSGYYDNSIRRDLLIKLRDGNLESDPAEYYDMQAEVESLEEILYIGTSSYNSKSILELEISEIFSDKIRKIRESITDSEVTEIFKDYVNADRLFLDIERYGYPKIIIVRPGVDLYAKVNSIEKNDFKIVLKSDDVTLEISHLSDCLKNSHPVLIVKDYKLCYSIYQDFEYSGVQLYWPV